MGTDCNLIVLMNRHKRSKIIIVIILYNIFHAVFFSSLSRFINLLFALCYWFWHGENPKNIVTIILYDSMLEAADGGFN